MSEKVRSLGTISRLLSYPDKHYVQLVELLYLIIDLRLTLRYLGIPIDGRSYLFGDNESVTKSANLPQSTLKK